MARFQMSQQIAAPVDETFRVFTDFRNAAGRVRGITALEVLTDGPIGVGTRFRETRVIMNRTATETMEVTRFEPNKLYSVGCDSCGARYDSTFRFTPQAGGTRVDFEMEARGTTWFAKLMSALMGWMVRGMIEKCFRQDIDDLKAHLEGRGAAGGAVQVSAPAS
ncbi:MAG: SRPBCC family protein [Phycisphaerae bacterium]